jgi:hypothetical protein
MVNCMAVALGSPRDSNHIYLRAFDIKQAAASFSPGSNLGRRMADSGVLLIFPSHIYSLVDILIVVPTAERRHTQTIKCNGRPYCIQVCIDTTKWLKLEFQNKTK